MHRERCLARNPSDAAGVWTSGREVSSLRAPSRRANACRRRWWMLPRSGLGADGSIRVDQDVITYCREVERGLVWISFKRGQVGFQSKHGSSSEPFAPPQLAQISGECPSLGLAAFASLKPATVHKLTGVGTSAGSRTCLSARTWHIGRQRSGTQRIIDT